MSTRSCASLRSPIAHITFWTFDDVFLPHTLSIASSCLFESKPSSRSEEANTSVEAPRFLRQHDRDAVADRVGELGGARDQLLLLGVVFQRRLCDRAHQELEQVGIDGLGGSVGWRGGHGRTRGNENS